MTNRKISERDWQIAFLQSLQTNSGGLESLFRLIDDVWSIHDSVDPTSAICKMINRWSQNPNVTLEKDGDDLRMVVAHLAQLNELMNSFNCLDINTKYINVAIENKREVQNG